MIDQIPPTSNFSYFLTRPCTDFDALRPEVRQKRLVDITFLIQPDRNLINDLQAASLADGGFNLFSLVRPHIILGEDALHRSKAVLNHCRIIGGAIVAQQILEDIDGNVRAFLDQLGQILAHDAPREMRIEQIVEAGIGHGRLRSRSHR